MNEMSLEDTNEKSTRVMIRNDVVGTTGTMVELFQIE